MQLTPFNLMVVGIRTCNVFKIVSIGINIIRLIIFMVEVALAPFDNLRSDADFKTAVRFPKFVILVEL